MIRLRPVIATAQLATAGADPRQLAWMPALGLKGFFAQDVFRHVAIVRVILAAGALGTQEILFASRVSKGGRAPSYLPQANAAARAFAKASGGTPLNTLMESVGNLSVTAHILGGAVMAARPADGVIDTNHEVFGHEGGCA